MVPNEGDYDPSIMKQALGVGEILGTKDHKQYHGSVPFDDGTPVYMIDQETFHKLIEDGIQILRNTRIQITPDVVKLFPDEIDFSVVRDDDSPDTIKLYLDRHFYTHDLDSYVYARYASMDKFFEEEELQNYEAHRTVPKLDMIEDEIVVKDDIRKAKGLEAKTKELPECLDKLEHMITPEDVYSGGMREEDNMPPHPTKGMWFYDGDEWYEIDDYSDDDDDDTLWDNWGGLDE